MFIKVVLLKQNFKTKIHLGQLRGSSPLLVSNNSMYNQRFQNCEVAVKVSIDLTLNKNSLIYREVEAMRQLKDNTYIISLLGWTMHNHSYCLITELATTNLLEHVRQIKKK
jgi:predicted DNA-binding helix-hairpin-helix protein